MFEIILVALVMCCVAYLLVKFWKVHKLHVTYPHAIFPGHTYDFNGKAVCVDSIFGDEVLFWFMIDKERHVCEIPLDSARKMFIYKSVHD